MEKELKSLSPKLREVLISIIGYEKARGAPWVWSDIPAYPAELMKLVTKGFVKVVGKDSYKRNLYQLVDREKIVEALKKMYPNIELEV